MTSFDAASCLTPRTTASYPHEPPRAPSRSKPIKYMNDEIVKGIPPMPSLDDNDHEEKKTNNNIIYPRLSSCITLRRQSPPHQDENYRYDRVFWQTTTISTTKKLPFCDVPDIKTTTTDDYYYLSSGAAPI